MLTVILFVGFLALLGVFQAALALGAPWGRLAWGGQHAGTLPTGYRIASGVAILTYGFIASLALDASGAIDLYPDAFSRVAMWVVVGYLALGILMNLVSRSKPERYTMAPVSLVLAVLALIIVVNAS